VGRMRADDRKNITGQVEAEGRRRGYRGGAGGVDPPPLISSALS